KALRLWAAVALPCLVAGMWLSASRTTLILVPVVLLVMFKLIGPHWPFVARHRRAMGLALLACGVFFFVAHPRSGETFGEDNALGVRVEMGLTTARMVASAPIFGVGIGQFRSSSSAFMSSRLRDWYKAENAHNQFFQVLGELGLTGLIVFIG